MKHFALIITLIIAFYSCSQRKNQNINNKLNQTEEQVSESIQDEEIIVQELDEIALFSYAKSFPTITDTFKFITELRDAFNLENAQFMEQKPNEKITAFKKIQINGSKREFILVEYDYIEGASASYPWKYQIIMTKEGKLIKILDGVRYELIKVFEDQAPLLLVLTSTSKGNGSHQLYKFSNDSLENVLDEMTGYFPRTYDAHTDQHINEPKELKLTVNDENNDGFPDLVFSGKIIYNSIQNDVSDLKNNKSIPVKLIFIYDKNSGHFKEFEDYQKKYSVY